MGCAYLAAMILNCNKKMLCCSALQRGCACTLASYVRERLENTTEAGLWAWSRMAQTGHNTGTKKQRKKWRGFEVASKVFFQSFLKGPKAAQEKYAGKIRFWRGLCGGEKWHGMREKQEDIMLPGWQIYSKLFCIFTRYSSTQVSEH